METERKIGQIIGYIAFAYPDITICSKNACIITGTQEAMRRYLAASTGHPDDFIIQETPFEEVMGGLLAGDTYAFDEDAYALFYALAKEDGIDLASEAQPGSVRRTGGFVHVEMAA